MYKKRYITPPQFDNIIMVSDGVFLTGLYFENSLDANKHSSKHAELLAGGTEAQNLPIFEETERWLNLYFAGINPQFVPKYRVENATPFRTQVLKILTQIPYGKTTTYGEIATQIARQKGTKKMSAQAVGGAVGWNPICLIIPCHRVVGGKGQMVGYGGGLNNKISLLELEKTTKTFN